MELAKTYYCHTIKINPSNMRALYGLLLVRHHKLLTFTKYSKTPKRHDYFGTIKILKYEFYSILIGMTFSFVFFFKSFFGTLTDNFPDLDRLDCTLSAWYCIGKTYERTNCFDECLPSLVSSCFPSILRTLSKRVTFNSSGYKIMTYR